MEVRPIERAFRLAQEQQGFVTSTDLANSSIDPALARQWYQRGRVERVGHGIYRFPHVLPTELDAYRLATLWAAGRGILSHETALQLHELCDVNPDKIHITIPLRYRPQRGGGALYAVHHADLVPAETTFVEGIPIVTPIRAIAEALDTAVPPHLVAQAIDTARRFGRAGTADLDQLEHRLGAPA